MAIHSDHRRSVMLSNEGQVLQNASHNDASTAIGVAQAQIDGLVNGMIRLDGAERTTAFLFTVADRAAGGIREITPTTFVLPAQTFQISAAPRLEDWSAPRNHLIARADEVGAQAKERRAFWRGFTRGYLIAGGIAVGALLLWGRF